MKSSIPKIIRDAEFEQFGVSKFDIQDEDISADRPEALVVTMIDAWVRSIVENSVINKDPEKWDRYHMYFGKVVVMDNEIFPGYLPIGYVLKCFWMNVDHKEPNLADTQKRLNEFLMSSNNRVHMYEAFEQKIFYITEGRTWYDVTVDGVEHFKSIMKSYKKLIDAKPGRPVSLQEKKELTIFSK